MSVRLDDYVSNSAERQEILLHTALALEDRATAESLVQHIILRQHVSVSAQAEALPEAAEIMKAILRVLRHVGRESGREALPERTIFSVGSVAYDYYDIQVRKEAADLLVEWAVPTWPPGDPGASPDASSAP